LGRGELLGPEERGGGAGKIGPRKGGKGEEARPVGPRGEAIKKKEKEKMKVGRSKRERGEREKENAIQMLLNLNLKI
jgi:hypothetical protein